MPDQSSAINPSISFLIESRTAGICTAILMGIFDKSKDPCKSNRAPLSIFLLPRRRRSLRGLSQTSLRRLVHRCVRKRRNLQLLHWAITARGTARIEDYIDEKVNSVKTTAMMLPVELLPVNLFERAMPELMTDFQREPYRGDLPASVATILKVAATHRGNPSEKQTNLDANYCSVALRRENPSAKKTNRDANYYRAAIHRGDPIQTTMNPDGNDYLKTLPERI